LDKDSPNQILENTAQSNKQGRWTPEEHSLFLEALRIYGKDWDAIQYHIKTRDAIHIRSHAQKFITKVKKAISNGEHKPDD
jgi:SHAQKYF class myb-like DNA-binding protein